MKYVILGSLGNISRPLAEKLIAAGHSVTIVSSKSERAEQIILLGAKAAIGSVGDVEFLINTFIGADAVYTMVPPNFGTRDWKQYISKIGENYASAIRSSKVKNVVNLSSVGAHMSSGCGPVSGLCSVEKSLDDLSGVNVRHLRAGFFYLNFLADINMIKEKGIIGGNYGDKTTLPLVHPKDIADVAAKELLDLSFRGKSIRYVVSEERTTKDIASILGKAIGKPQLSWVNFSDADALSGMMHAGLPEEIAKNFTEMGSALRSGEMMSDYIKNRPKSFEKRKLESFATSEFATAYRQQSTVRSGVGH